MRRCCKGAIHAFTHRSSTPAAVYAVVYRGSMHFQHRIHVWSGTMKLHRHQPSTKVPAMQWTLTWALNVLAINSERTAVTGCRTYMPTPNRS
jgi:hypothetical protein